MGMAVPLDLEPMEAKLEDEIPEGEKWAYEPKWDGFRCLIFREGGDVQLRSKAGKPLGRYFPDIVSAALALSAERFVLDGEVVIPAEGALSFDDLLLRIHPAASRVKKLAAERPAEFIAFDLLADAGGTSLKDEPLAKRRQALDTFAAEHLAGASGFHLSPSTSDIEAARRWLSSGREGLDGIIAKRIDLPYQAGKRTGMVKVKRLRTAECVIGGFRWSKDGKRVGSLLLGLFDADGKLNHVGFCSSLKAATRKEASELLPPLRGGKGFTGRAPNTESRWRKEGSGDWERVEPSVVVEVRYDHFTSGRFRHATRFLRWRPDKPPQACTMEQIEREGRSAMTLME
ncbi:MAG: ATP-dependent DNA ligase [Gemmatimonadota bacterium]